MAVSFELLHTCKQTGARAGILHTPHGDIETPVFMPVGTQATVKALPPEMVFGLGAHIILSNTYHLEMRPTSELIREAGGLHGFMRWPGAILTDSGGFQVFSLKGTRKVSEQGVEFQSHIDGSRHLFSPEEAMRVQRNLGADIAMSFDECSEHTASYEYAKQAMERTHDWAQRGKAAMKQSNQALFGIVQGGMFEDLRMQAARTIDAMDFSGNAIGGLSVGEEKSQMYRLIDVVSPLLNPDRPRYLMGVGSPDCLLQGVLRGIDMFDCVMQTRMGRTAAAFSPNGKRINLRNAQFTRDFSVIDPHCSCPACSGGFTKAYLRHLTMAGEILAATLISAHNIAFTLHLMKDLREAIFSDKTLDYANENSFDA
jgi:queuine tRNA-ribosyltransferase